ARARGATRGGGPPAGARLPPIRDLARDLGVNRETVADAYRQLAALGLTESRVGRGARLPRGGARTGPPAPGPRLPRGTGGGTPAPCRCGPDHDRQPAAAARRRRPAPRAL